MNKMLLAGLTATIFLTACSNNEDKQSTATKQKTETTEQVTNKSADAKKKIEKQKVDKEKSSTEESTTEPVTTEQATIEKDETVSKSNSSIDISNIVNRADLETVIYSGNYSEVDQIQAYNSAVANGVIPQGNVMEGPASKAYESSLRIESGQEKSIYEQIDETSEDTSDESSTNTDEISYDPNNPYMNLPDQEWRKNAGGLSSGEIQTRNAILNGTYEGDNAEQVLDAINYYEQKYGQ